MTAHQRIAPAPSPSPSSAPSTTTEQARADALLKPRFYTTDFVALDRTDVSPVREEWDALVGELEADGNRRHFRRDERWAAPPLDSYPPALRDEIVDFLVSSLTAEFSGCVLYKEMKRQGSNPDLVRLFGAMARDESRHAQFLNGALRDHGIAVDLGVLTRTKRATFFRPKFIFYATYLSEKIGYARYITIFRHLERHPERRFHPIFHWFEEWCRDEYRHGEAFALMIRADPKLTRGVNRLWTRFFQLAVYATMSVRDHERPALFEALGLAPDEFGRRVFAITSAISRQCFPTLPPIDDPRFASGLARLRSIASAMGRAKAKGGALSLAKRAALAAAAAAEFARLYLLPQEENALPDTVRLEPVW